MKIEYYNCTPEVITPSIAWWAGKEHDADYKELLRKAEVEVIDIEQPNDEIMEAVQNSYYTITVSIVVSYKGRLYRSDGQVGSYETGDWTEWREVERRLKQVAVYEYI